MKLYLQTQVVGWVWPTGCSFLAPYPSERLVGWATVQHWGCGKWPTKGCILKVGPEGFTVEQEVRGERGIKND